jgi:hypothetical protein
LAMTSEPADYAFLVSDENHIYVSWQSAKGYLFQAID